MTLSEILAVLRSRWWAIVLTGVLGLLIGAGVAVHGGNREQSKSVVLLQQTQTAAAGSVGLSTQQKLTLLAVTYASVVTQPKFVTSAAQAAGVSVANSTVTATAQPNTPIIAVTVKSDSRSQAVALNGAIDSQLSAEVSGGVSAGLSVATLQDPTGSSASTGLVFGMVVGLVVGLALAAVVVLLAASV